MKKTEKYLKVILDTIDWNYPNCGGIIVSKGNKYFIVRIESNFTGNRTGLIFKYPITDYSLVWDANDWKEIANEIDFVNTKYNDKKIIIISKGYKVQ